MIRTANITGSVSRNAGGLFNSVRRLSQTLAELPNTDITVMGLQDAFSEQDKKEWLPLVPSLHLARRPRTFGFSPGLRHDLFTRCLDLVHTHGIWQYPSVLALQWHRRTAKPHVVSPRGMLDAWALRNSRWKKRIAAWLFENAHLREAACIHALCKSEAESIRAYGLKNPIAIIPNGIDIPELGKQKAESSHLPWAAYVESGRKVLLYLGRIHPKKGLVNLLKAWKQASGQLSVVSGPVVSGPVVRSQSSDWVLAIAGWDQAGHEAELKRLATGLGIPWADVREAPSPLWGEGGRRPDEMRPIEVSNPSNILQPPPSLVFIGPQFGDDKAACYANCDAFILPSFSEGLPMVVLEAWAYARPVLMTPECNLPEGFAADAAICIEPNVASIGRALEDLFRTPHSALRAMGENGRSLVAEKFAWPKIAVEMKSVYEWLLGGGAKPACLADF